MNSKTESPYCVNCRTKRLANGVWECLVENPHFCPNVLEFGFSHHICRHPEPDTFRSNDMTKRAKPETDGF
jgi:hypothetical protein